MNRDEQSLLVRCPTCGCRQPYTSTNRWRPFCSERCRSIDLGAWASERFRVPAHTEPAEDDGPDAIGPRSPGP